MWNNHKERIRGETVSVESLLQAALSRRCVLLLTFVVLCGAVHAQAFGGGSAHGGGKAMGGSAAAASVSYDSTAHGNGLNVGNYSFSMTIGSGTNRIAYCVVRANSASNTGVTINGVSMSLVYDYNLFSTNHVILWWLAAPTSGAQTVTTVISDMFTDATTNCATYAGALQTAPGNFTHATSASPLNISLTTMSDKSWIMTSVFNLTADAVSAGTATTLRNSYQGLAILDSNLAETPTGSYTLQATGDSTLYGIIVEIPHA